VRPGQGAATARWPGYRAVVLERAAPLAASLPSHPRQTAQKMARPPTGNRARARVADGAVGFAFLGYFFIVKSTGGVGGRFGVRLDFSV
jgi:hypothetical protein